MQTRIINVVLLLVALSFYSGCKQSATEALGNYMMAGYNAAIQSGVDGPSYPGQFNRLFPGSQNIISYYTGVVGPSAWTSSIGLHGRYVFKVHLEVGFDETRTKIVSYGPPTFYLYELTKIDVKTNQNPVISNTMVTTFDGNSWARFVQAKCDFSVLGITLQTNNPVEHFEEYWKER
jgi:hypothetical protein